MMYVILTLLFLAFFGDEIASAFEWFCNTIADAVRRSRKPCDKEKK